MSARTESRTFIGANVRGTPPMPAGRVREDVRTLKRLADVLALQEFRWVWYWQIAERMLGVRWRAYPSFVKAILRPVLAAQGVLWRRRAWKRTDATHRLLHRGRAGISEDRYLRAVRLADRVKPGLACWYASTHFVVGGDEAGDSDERKAILAEEDIPGLDGFLSYLTRDGDAVVMQFDGNIRPGTWAYKELMKVLRKHDARIVGEHGVEYLIVIDGRRAEVVVVKAFVVPTSRLNTNHEARGIEHYLRTSR